MFIELILDESFHGRLSVFVGITAKQRETCVGTTSTLPRLSIPVSTIAFIHSLNTPTREDRYYRPE